MRNLDDAEKMAFQSSPRQLSDSKKELPKNAATTSGQTNYNQELPRTVRFVEIDQDYIGQRLDNYLIRVLKGVPKAFIYRIVRKGQVRVNKKRVSVHYRIQEGDCLRIPPVRQANERQTVKPGDNVIRLLEQSLLYEDAKLLVINKPSGLAVHGGSGLAYGVIEALRVLRPECKTLELVHRLDRDTSGCLVIAKKRSVLRFFHKQLQQREKVEKRYYALVVGKWPDHRQNVEVPLQKNILQSGERIVRIDCQGKQSQTLFRVLKRFEEATLVEASPVTGRTHQIRVHCQHVGHTIAGDDKYGQDQVNNRFAQIGLKRLFLHAASIRFELPEGGFLKVVSPLPQELSNLLTSLSEYNERC